MCGIVGILSLDGASIDPTSIQEMCDAIVHRGPDDEGAFVSGTIGLGMRRLSIIDLEGGRQPMHNEDGSLTIIFNGEIYNYREVRRKLEALGHAFRTSSDTESILHAYEEFGPDCLGILNGMFAIAIWDAQSRRLFLARDRLGIKPLYLFRDKDRLMFASEIKAILTDRTIPRTLDLEAFSYFLRYGYVAAPATMYASIRKLPAAHYLLASAGSVCIKKYWHVDYDDAPGSLEDHAESMSSAVRAAVERQLVSDVPIGAFLSSGLDSSSIVYFMSEVTKDPVRTYSIGFSDPDSFQSELDDARLMSSRHHTRHHEILMEPDVGSLIPRLVHHMDEPIADSSFVVTYLISALARESVKVILSGVGGDEIFGGYRRYLGARLAPWFQWAPGRVRRALGSVADRLPVDRGSRLRNYFRLGRSFVAAQGFPPFEQYDHAVRLMSDSALDDLSPAARHTNGSLLSARREAFESVKTNDPLVRAMHLDLATSLPESLLLLTDKMGMAASLEVRVPFLDHELVEAAARVPAALKVKRTRLRYVQKESMRGHLPSEVLSRRKRGFGFPIGSRFRREMETVAGDLFSRDRLERQGLLNPDAVHRMVADHHECRQDYSDALLGLLTFQMWMDQARP